MLVSLFYKCISFVILYDVECLVCNIVTYYDVTSDLNRNNTPTQLIISASDIVVLWGCCNCQVIKGYGNCFVTDCTTILIDVILFDQKVINSVVKLTSYLDGWLPIKFLLLTDELPN